jgi:hypothetical protein
MIRKANPPSSMLSASMMAKMRCSELCSFLMRCARISLSEVEWKRLPLSSK